MGALDEAEKNAKLNLSKIKRVIGVYSGKGGVGKTTVAVNLAASLAQQGFRVCLLDADIDCPNIGHALGLEGEIDLEVLGGRIIPLERYGMKVLSMAPLQKDGEATVWRGPMVTDMLMKFLGAANWGAADYLIIDMPPGTSDIPLTVMKFVQPHGIILVTTPRSIAAVDAKKSGALAKMTDVKILGVIENMSGEPFGTGVGKICAQSLQTAFLGTVGFDKIYLSSVDEGKPAVLDAKAKETFAQLIKEMQQAEQKLLGDTPKPAAGALGKAKNFTLDFKEELLDRYKHL